MADVIDLCGYRKTRERFRQALEAKLHVGDDPLRDSVTFEEVIEAARDVAHRLAAEAEQDEQA